MSKAKDDKHSTNNSSYFYIASVDVLFFCEHKIKNYFFIWERHVPSVRIKHNSKYPKGYPY